MATAEEIIFEDHLYKLTGNKGKSIWNKNNPWKQKYFVLKQYDDIPVLEYYNKKPKNKNATPKDKIVLWPKYRVEKVTNTRNRAYVFEITTQDKYICLSAEEQRQMDIFVFILQAQMRLKEQIKDDLIIVQPENSEAQRRIGAKGTNCILHVSPWGVTLALQSSRSVLAQWPTKSVRYFEASSQGKFLLEAGRVAPMGDGLYVFTTQKGKDSYVYDLLDQHIVDALGRLQPGRRGTTEEMEDYVIEADKLASLTIIRPCTMSQPELPKILMENWNCTLSNDAGFKPKPTVHVRQNSNNPDSSSSGPPPPLPNRRPSDSPHISSSTRRQPSNSALNQSFQNESPGTPRLAERPPLPPPASSSNQSTPRNQPTPRNPHTKPLNIPKSGGSGQEVRSSQAYFRMDSSSSTGALQSLSMNMSPTGNWTPPPTFQEAIGYSPMGEMNVQRDGYLTPRNSAELAAQTKQNGDHVFSEQYILPTHEQDNSYSFSSLPRPSSRRHSNDRQRTSNYRMSRLRSVSCEEVNNTYLGGAVLREKSKKTKKDHNENDPAYDLARPQAPFRNLQDFRGSMEMLCDNDRRASLEYYNITGLKGTVDTSKGPSVAEVRRRFNDGARPDVLKRSISNPNFLQLQNKEKLHDVRSSNTKYGFESQTLNGKKKSKSLLSLFKKSGRDSRGSFYDRASLSSSNPSSPSGTLTRDTGIPMTSIGGKEVYFTERTRSFRKPKPKAYGTEEGMSHGNSGELPSRSPATTRRYEKSPVASRQNSSNILTRHENTKSPPLSKRDNSSSSYINVDHSRSSSDLSNRSENVIHSRSGSDISSRNGNVIHSRSGSDLSNNRNSNEMRRTSSSSSSKVQTVC